MLVIKTKKKENDGKNKQVRRWLGNEKELTFQVKDPSSELRI